MRDSVISARRNELWCAQPIKAALKGVHHNRSDSLVIMGAKPSVAMFAASLSCKSVGVDMVGAALRMMLPNTYIEKCMKCTFCHYTEAEGACIG